MKCTECGSTMTKKPYIHATRVGRYLVKDTGAGLRHVCACGNVILTEAQLSGYELRAARAILQCAKGIGGPEVKFARKALGLRQTELAALLGSSETEPSRWENSEAMTQKWLRLALLGLVDEALARGADHLNEIGTSTDREYLIQAS